ncbi:hypothetical protein HBI42_063980 [Parastagonospora nodorum]|nr:hypothetical protein HBI43_071170 [Parastagonospora nodorum]KAH6265258.1 hypothetical protein HBI42_063980 [Parastagonospora nodorum]
MLGRLVGCAETGQSIAGNLLRNTMDTCLSNSAHRITHLERDFRALLCFTFHRYVSNIILLQGQHLPLVYLGAFHQLSVHAAMNVAVAKQSVLLVHTARLLTSLSQHEWCRSTEKDNHKMSNLCILPRRSQVAFRSHTYSSSRCTRTIEELIRETVGKFVQESAFRVVQFWMFPNVPENEYDNIGDLSPSLWWLTYVAVAHRFV